ncbi:isocitrate lyase/PEP mutase family protein [Streptomyces mirabilis]|uniref:isocitrate lyase/PEP mutase family protein n=1 Tax=Streptomyces mirabilis TaxID=68239 RepID=UPI0033166FF1
MPDTTPAARLRELLAADRLVIAPGIYDGLSATLVERRGFPAAYISGAAASVSVLGEPDLGLMTMSEMAAHTSRMRAATSLPLIVDIDTGYGNELNVRRTIETYRRLGVAAVHIEDQVFPKRCGHLAGKAVVPVAEAASKVRAAVAAREDDDMIIIARTDARAPLGLVEAVDRANAYVDAGADMIFLEAPESERELEAIANKVRAPLVANVLARSKTPVCSAEYLQEMGFRLAIYPLLAITAAAAAVDAALGTLAHSGLPPTNTQGPAELFGLVGLDRWLSWSKEYETAPSADSKNTGLT